MRALVSSKVFFTWTLTSALILSNVKAANYGEQCMSSEDCVSGTTCSSNKCVCLSSHFYDESSSQCSIRIGNGDPCDSRKTSELQCSDDNAHCDSDTCSCKTAYYLGGLNNCVARGTEGENCQTSEHCIDNAECVDVGGGSKECKCSVGYKFTQSTSTCNGALGGPLIDMFLICMIYLMGVFISSVFN